MKYLLIFLFLFSTHAFSGEIDDKQLVCVWPFKLGNYDGTVGYAFNNDIVNFYYIQKSKKDGSYDIIKTPLTYSYRTDSNNIYFNRWTLNRKNLTITYKGDSAVATCEILDYDAFLDKLGDRRDKINNDMKKAREGNKI